MAGEPNLYELLQVDRRASQEVIEAAYHRLVRKYHPDLNKSADASIIMQRLNNAYAILRDPIKRGEYDRRVFGTQERSKAEEKTEPPRDAGVPEPINSKWTFD